MKDVDGELVDDPKERYWGMESHIATMGGSGFGGEWAYPGLAVAMSFDRPGGGDPCRQRNETA